MDNLRKKSFISVSFCCLCKREEEIVDHCSFAKVVEYDFAIFGVQWVMPRGVVTLCFGQHPNSGIWEAILHFFFFFWCGVFGGRGICKALRDMNKQSYIWNNNILELCLNGWQWQDFFFFLSWACWILLIIITLALT